jgi:uncharacterized RmlC-like cupin family protein
MEMARMTSRRKGAGKKANPRKVAPKSKAKAAVRKKAATAPRESAAKARAKTAMKKAAPKKSVARVPAKKAQAKKSVARVPVARRPAARRSRATAQPRRKVAGPRLKAASGPQRFTVSHLNESDFKPDGLRPYALYRDLGIAAVTGGLCQAHVIRLLSPCTDEVRKRHLHEPELQLIYVLQGWVKNEFEGQGVQMMSAGSCWLQPPGIKHTVLDYSADVELLEIVVPADFKTVELD